MRFIYKVSGDGINYKEFSSRFTLDKILSSAPLNTYIQWIGFITYDSIRKLCNNTKIFHKTFKGVFIHYEHELFQ